MKTSCFDTQSSLKISPETVHRLTEAVLTFKQVKTDEVIFHFVDKSTMTKLHEEFFHDPTPTDCISFPIDASSEEGDGYHILGEVFVCPEVAIEQAKTFKQEPYREVSLYCIHGLLHLLGYDDLDPRQEKMMREEEKRCMNKIETQRAWIDAST